MTDHIPFGPECPRQTGESTHGCAQCYQLLIKQVALAWIMIEAFDEGIISRAAIEQRMEALEYLAYGRRGGDPGEADRVDSGLVRAEARGGLSEI